MNKIIISMVAVVATFVVTFVLMRTGKPTDVDISKKEPISASSEHDSATAAAVVDTVGAPVISKTTTPVTESTAKTSASDKTEADKIALASSEAIQTLMGTTASVTTGVGTYSLKPDALGIFPRLHVAAGEVVQIEISLPAGIPGLPVALQVDDGGKIVDHGRAVIQTLGNDGKLAFGFQVGHQTGIYRVEVRVGDEIRFLNFWLGEDI